MYDVVYMMYDFLYHIYYIIHQSKWLTVVGKPRVPLTKLGNV